MRYLALLAILALVWLVGLFAFADRVRSYTPTQDPAPADAIVALTGPSSERVDAAIRLLEGYAPRAPAGLPNLGRAYAMAGRTDDARAELARLQALGAEGIGVGYHVAQILATLGEREAALDALESGMADRSQQMGWLRLEPAFALLRDEPRFKGLVERLRLA